MSTSYNYHQPSAPDFPESEDDNDRDVQEIIPGTSSAFAVRKAPGDGAEVARGSRIPLKDLSPGKSWAHGNFRRKRHEDDNEDDDWDASRGLLGRNFSSPQETSNDGFDNDTGVPVMYGRKRRKQSDGFTERPVSGIRLLSSDWSGTHGVEDSEVQERDHDPTATRTVEVGRRQSSRFPPNTISNARYTAWSFLPRILYNEFSFFFNLYFLLVALSQIIPPLRIGYLSTYVVPLAFVLSVTLGKEALDDITRRRRDTEANSEAYTVLDFTEVLENEKPFSDASKKNGFGKIRNSKARKGKGSRSRLSEIDEEEANVQYALTRQKLGVREMRKRSAQLKVGDVLKLTRNQRVPADVVILQSITGDVQMNVSPEVPHLDISTSELSMAQDDASAVVGKISRRTEHVNQFTPTDSFIKTDQLDGETDWKLRLSTPLTGNLNLRDLVDVRVTAGRPEKKVTEFVGTVELRQNAPVRALGEQPPSSLGAPLSLHAPPQHDDNKEKQSALSAPLTIDNTAWANTVLASNSIVYAAVIYTGSQTRQALSTTPSRAKTGLLEYEINSLTKILCFLTLAVSFALVALEGFAAKDGRKWYVAVLRFLILFSTIVPISLRVNLDMGKTVYAWYIERDKSIPGTLVRTSTIPEDLGRVEYLLSDKTGTLTQNHMVFKKIHVGTVSYANEAMDEVALHVQKGFPASLKDDGATVTGVQRMQSTLGITNASTTRSRRDIGARVRDVVVALAVCHNVTPTAEEVDGKLVTSYQASSPDEIAIVQWTEHVGLRLVHRDRESLVLQSTASGEPVIRVKILNIFPFTSETKRMGIVVRFCAGSELPSESDDVWFYEKGADSVMTSIVASNDWLEEETANMAREGLRTLVVGRKQLSANQYQRFSAEYNRASLAIHGREAGVAKVVKEHLERDLELLGVTGVEDKLQRDVRPSLELLRNAGIKIWMLTGDKVETARCIAVSAKLVARNQHIHVMTGMRQKDLAADSLSFLRSQPSSALLIDGETLALLLTFNRTDFISTAVRLPAVIACRCSPSQKAEIATLIKTYTQKRVCCIGDGGNDVSMIQAADVGVGIVGKEGRQASLAADFSIEQFCYLTKLLVWHGRNSYKRSAKLAQFVIHRGLIISVCQTMFTIASKFEPIALYKDWLLVGYATLYTMAPVFSLVLDRDVDEHLANLYPELYRELSTSRSLSYGTFFAWVAVSIYQGSIIQGLSQLLSDPSWYSTGTISSSPNGTSEWNTGMKRMVSISFTALVINELAMVAMEVTTWHPIMIFSLLGTAGVYVGSLPFLGRYFDLAYLLTLSFWWRVGAIAAIAVVPVGFGRWVRRWWRPESYRKVQGV